jgi:hypothetical protein
MIGWRLPLQSKLAIIGEHKAPPHGRCRSNQVIACCRRFNRSMASTSLKPPSAPRQTARAPVLFFGVRATAGGGISSLPGLFHAVALERPDAVRDNSSCLRRPGRGELPTGDRSQRDLRPQRHANAAAYRRLETWRELPSMQVVIEFNVAKSCKAASRGRRAFVPFVTRGHMRGFACGFWVDARVRTSGQTRRTKPRPPDGARRPGDRLGTSQRAAAIFELARTAHPHDQQTARRLGTGGTDRNI